MITIIVGMPRAGKTALMTKLALDYMTGENAAKDIRMSCKEIKKFNEGGFKFTYPKKHLVYSDYDIWTRSKMLFSYYATGFTFGLPNDNYDGVGFYPPCSRFFFDEAQRYWNSREFGKFSDFVSRAFEIHGHMKYNVYISLQRIGLLDKNIRELSPCVIEVLSMTNKTDNGLILSSTWKTKVYDSAGQVEKKLSGNNARGKTKYFRFKGNIFKHYDSEGQRFAFLRGRENADFDMSPNGGYACTVADVERFNKEHSYAMPKNFQKGEKKK